MGLLIPHKVAEKIKGDSEHRGLSTESFVIIIIEWNQIMQFLSPLWVCMATSIPALTAELSEAAPTFEIPKGKYFILSISVSPAATAVSITE